MYQLIGAVAATVGETLPNWSEVIVATMPGPVVVARKTYAFCCLQWREGERHRMK